MGVCSIVLLVELAPPLYHVYLGLAVFFWTEVLGDTTSILKVINILFSSKLSWFTKLFAMAATSLLVMELLVSIAHRVK